MAGQQKHDAQQLAEMDNKNKIRHLFLSGMSRAQIARELDISDTYIGRVLNEVADSISMEMIELSQFLSGMNLARTEYLLSKTWPYATGDGFDSGIPDPRMMKIALDIIKMQNDFIEAVEKRKAEADEKARQMGTISHIESTFPTTSEMYKLAQAHMEADWMGEDPPDSPIDVIYNFKDQPQTSEAANDRIAELEAKLAKLTQEEEDEDDEEAS